MVYTYVCMLQYFAQTSMTLEFRMTMGSLYHSYREVETFNVYRTLGLTGKTCMDHSCGPPENECLFNFNIQVPNTPSLTCTFHLVQ